MVTDRLTLDRLSSLDAATLHLIRGDQEAMRFWDWPADQSVTETEQALALFREEESAHRAIYRPAYSRLDGSFVGLFDLSDITNSVADLGFMVQRSLWGQGYGQEGANALVTFARGLGIATLTARCHSANDASRALLIRLGFQPTHHEMIEVRPQLSVMCDRFSLVLSA